MRAWKKLSCIISLLLLVTGCVYKIEIQQGNKITPRQVERLELGMSEGEVKSIVGTPLLLDPFSPGRWDYIYQLQEKGDLVERRRLTVFFDENKRLYKIEKE